MKWVTRLPGIEVMLLPAGVAPEARLLLIGRALRAFTDGFVAILLPVYLLGLGLGKWEVGLISTATLLGSAVVTPGERTAAASFTAVPRSLAAAGGLRPGQDRL